MKAQAEPSEESFVVWEGIYSRLEDVPTKGPGFGGETWNDSLTARHEQAAKPEHGNAGSLPRYGQSLLPAILAGMTPPSQAPVRVLDYGGATGVMLQLARASMPNGAFDFTVKEVPEVCALGERLWNGNSGIRFTTTMPRESFDVVHLGSVLQYENDWKSTLAACAEAAETWLLLTDIQAGNQPTFATGQIYYESIIPSWFFNASELIRTVESIGMELVFSAAFDSVVRGRAGLPLWNFPKEYQDVRAYHYLFRQTKPRPRRD